MKNIRLGDQLLQGNFFENFDFESSLFSKKCAQFLLPLFIILVGLTRTSFTEKILISNRRISTLFDAQRDQKNL